ncbi:MAG: hypothetical protein NVSMB51_05080 [Solirubrobacteraceae bacterium]
MPRERTLAVALHDVEPATFERCALIRDWLTDHGVERVTLLVIPARDLHPVQDRRPEMTAWLRERARSGDALAQHGFQHLQARRASWPRRAVMRGEAEFVGLDREETRRAVDAGRRVLKLAGIEPRGFIAPAYAYTPALRETLAGRFDWWAGLLHVHAGQRSGERLLSPPVRLDRSPCVGALLAGSSLRVDLHPDDLGRTGRMLALERLLHRAARRRTAITYEELAQPRLSGGAA